MCADEAGLRMIRYGLLVAAAFFVASCGGSGGAQPAAAPTTPSSAPPVTESSTATSVGTAPTTTVPSSVQGKPCVGLKDPLPKGSPAMPLEAGPAPTKLVTQDLKVGTGAVVPEGATVTVDYVGVACSTGKIFDSSYSRNQPFQAQLVQGQIIDGWDQGIPGMRIGGVRLLAIPPALAYGSEGNTGIAPDEALFFLVHAERLG